MGGNLEVSPPIKGHPFGVTLLADTEIRQSKPFRKFMAAQSPAMDSFVSFDFSSMPELAHIDEVVSFIPSKDGTDFYVLVASLKLAVDIFKKYPDVRVSSDATYASIANQFSPMGIDGAEMKAYGTALDLIATTLGDKFEPRRIVRFPCVPRNKVYRMTNTINLVALVPNTDPLTPHLMIPKPHALDDKYQKELIALLTAAPIGYSVDRVHFIDSTALTSGGGDLHCGTNAKRKTPPIPQVNP
jgi:hypothetical protein